ncbi:hypothetical protein ACFQLX_21665 [Streptomyces polyrhachis]|uniref:Uncharacterized protein n=1 Tax=Streptomyces polyrhachis TaxID=1282885 RepID=A0ABW2GKQ3_9ACTN
MSHAGPLEEGRIHWWRSLACAVPFLLAAGGIGGAMASGAIAVDMKVQNRTFNVNYPGLKIPGLLLGSSLAVMGPAASGLSREECEGWGR